MCRSEAKKSGLGCKGEAAIILDPEWRNIAAWREHFWGSQNPESHALCPTQLSVTAMAHSSTKALTPWHCRRLPQVHSTSLPFSNATGTVVYSAETQVYGNAWSPWGHLQWRQKLMDPAPPHPLGRQFGEAEGHSVPFTETSEELSLSCRQLQPLLCICTLIFPSSSVSLCPLTLLPGTTHTRVLVSDSTCWTLEDQPDCAFSWFHRRKHECNFCPRAHQPQLLGSVCRPTKPLFCPLAGPTPSGGDEQLENHWAWSGRGAC